MKDAPLAEPQGRPTTYNLLFVCTGNTCRSPMAMTIARREVEERGWGQLVGVRSAGIAAEVGQSASPHAREVALEQGLELGDHVAAPLTPELVEWADLVLVMGMSHAAVVAGMGGAEKVALVTDFCDGEHFGEPVEDPFGGDLAAYRRAWDQLERAVRAALGRLEPILAP